MISFFHILKIWPAAVTPSFTYLGKNGENGTIFKSNDVLDIETQIFAFGLILGWKIQKWCHCFLHLFKIGPPAVMSYFLMCVKTGVYPRPRTTRETDVKLQNHGKKCEDGLRFLQPFPQKLMKSFHFFCKSEVILSTIIFNYQRLKMWHLRGVKSLVPWLTPKFPNAVF